MIERLLPWILLTAGGFWSVTSFSPVFRLNLVANAQSEVSDSVEPESLYYNFYDQRILLSERTDQVAVQFTEGTGTRGGIGEAIEPAYLQLQRDLQSAFSDTRDISQPAARIEVTPLGNQYAIVTLPENTTRGGLENPVLRQLDRPYVAATLPVLTREGGEDSIVVTPEIIVSFNPDTTESEVAAILAEAGLEIVRPLQFSQGRYLVSSPNATGTAILEAANQLDGAPNVQSATPNFIQSVPYSTQPATLQKAPASSAAGEVIRPLESAPLSVPFEGDFFEGNFIEKLKSVSATLTPAVNAATETSATVLPQAFSFPSSLLSLQWYLNSIPMRPGAKTRTDIHALEAWTKGDELGEGITVAVIDSLMQWDHPDLSNSVYKLSSDVEDRLPGEVSGWDFSGNTKTCAAADVNNCAFGDPDTRASEEEVAAMRPAFQDTIALSDSDLLAAYSDFDEYIQANAPSWSESERADYIRYAYQSQISAEFHGTWSTGVITALPQNSSGMVGVAPRSQFLPVRVFGLGGSISIAALVEASGYAAARNVDVINFSLGGAIPNEEFNNQLTDIMAADPNVVIIAAAGNENVSRVSYPAAIPDLVAVGSTNITGNRSRYSSYGLGLDVVAPGGETGDRLTDGILTTGGTWTTGFWQGLDAAIGLRAGGPSLDRRGRYVGVQGTSFASPLVAGVVALMKDVDDNDQLSRSQIVDILQSSADYDELVISPADAAQYQSLSTTEDFSQLSAEQIFFGNGLVDAEVAVDGVKKAINPN